MDTISSRTVAAWTARSAWAAVALTALAGPVTAWGYVWFGNPQGVVVSIERPEDDLASATAAVTAVRMHACGGGYTDYPVGATLDLTDPITVEIDAGAWCGASVRWGSAVTVSNGSWTTSYTEPYTSVTIDEDPEDASVALTPFDVVSGSFSGNAPRLRIHLADG